MIPTRKHFRVLLLGLTLSLGLMTSLLAPRAALAQGITTGGLTGVTVDQTGAVLPNAKIVALNNATGARIEQQSRADGGFSVLNLQTGTYTVTFSLTGFSDGVLKDVRVEVGSRDLGTLTLKPSSTVTTVEVSDTAPLLETTQAQVSTTFDTLEIANLPLANGFDAVTLLEPGVTQTHDNNFSNQ